MRQGDDTHISGTRGNVIGVGRNAYVELGDLTQIWNENAAGINLPALAEELARLKEQLLAEASGGEDYALVGAVAEAEQAAGTGNGPKVLEFLAKVGRRGLDVATKIGAEVAVAAIKAGTGL